MPGSFDSTTTVAPISFSSIRQGTIIPSRRGIYLLATLFILSLHALKADDTEQAKQLFVRAAATGSLSDRRFSTHLTFQIFGVKGGEAKGTIDVVANGEWLREEITGPNYHKLTIQNADKKYIVRSTPYDPLRITQLSDLLELLRAPLEWQPE